MDVATYSRKSSQDKARPGKSVQDQQRESRAEAERRGWTVAYELCDEISASRHSRKPRPDFDRLLRLIEAGSIGAVLLAEQSRLTRRLSVLGVLLESCADAGVLLILGSTEVDLSQPEGMLLSGIQGTVDMVEAERIRARILRGQRGAALRGRPSGHTPWGFRRVYDPVTRAFLRQEPDPEVVPVIRAAVEELLAGHSLRSVTMKYAPKGEKDTGFKAKLTAPYMAGHRVLRGEIVMRDAWEAIVTDAEQQEILRLFPGTDGVRLGGRKHLLSGLATCAVCHGPMRAHIRNGGAPRRYYCRNGHTTLNATDTEDYVVEAILARLSKPEVLAAIGTEPDANHTSTLEAIRKLRGRLDEIADEVAEGNISAKMAGQAEAKIESQIQQMEAAMRPQGLPPALTALLAGDVRQAWDGLDLEQRISIIRSLCTITISRTSHHRGSHRFDRTRVEISWI